MSLGKIARRSFLIGSAAVAGGVAFGVWYARKPVDNPLDPEGEALALNPYVIVDRAGVSIVVPRAEMGQGVRTTLAALVAEELDVEMDAIRTLHGPASDSYYNGALAGLGLPFKDYAMSDLQHAIREQMGVMGKALGLQVTGGSTSTVDAFDKMRHAGAAARETLKAAAAERLGVPADALSTGAGAVIAPDGARLPYPELAEAAARIDPPRAPALRPAAEWRILGKSQPRVDMVEKATGTARFGLDVRLPGMKFATVRMNPRLGAPMRSFDASAAEEMPGVERVIDLGTGIAVVASNTWLAFRAAEAVEIDWAEAPYPDTTEALFAEIARAFDAAPNSALRDEGDADTVPKGATKIAAEYRVPYLAHATMEPVNATALLDGDRLEVWGGFQSPTLVRDHCAEAAGVAPEAVRVHTTYLGGGFGRRGEVDFAVLAALVAREMPGTPVQVAWSREEDMGHDFYRPGALARFRGAVRDGRAVLLDGAIAAQSVTRESAQRLAGFAPPGADKGHVEGAYDQPYAIPNYRIRGHLAEMKLPIGFWRAVGASFNGFFHDSFIDELAHAAGADPLEFRLAHMREVHAPSAGVLDAVREMSGWTGETPDGTGRGVAFTYSFGTPTAQVVEVVDEDGAIRIARAWIACDVGTALDPRIVESQMVSGLLYGLSAAVMGEITFEGGEAQQGNFPDYDALRIHSAPAVEVRVLETAERLSGVGEPGTPPSMPALANAVFDLTGERVRELPLARRFDFVT